MIKRTLYFGSPAYLSYRLNQLVIKRAIDDNGTVQEATKTVPIEDIGLLIVDHSQITLTSGLVDALLEGNVALIVCNSSHMPVGMMLSLVGHSVQNERVRYQLEASLPLKKALWQQTIESKIKNQAAVLKYVTGECSNNIIC